MLKYYQRDIDDPIFYCFGCNCEIFNILFVSKRYKREKNQTKTKKIVYCEKCAFQHPNLQQSFTFFYQYTLEELRFALNQFQGVKSK
jgi:hypothetical protein